jgi:hypothetical protein
VPRGTRRILHWGPGGEGDGLACGVGGGYYSMDWNKVTCLDCLATRPTHPDNILRWG